MNKTTPKKRIESIEITQVEWPISNTEYIIWQSNLVATPSKVRRCLEEFFRAIFSLADPEWLTEFIRIKINGQKLTYVDLIKYYDDGAVKDAIKEIKRIKEGNLSNLRVERINDLESKISTPTLKDPYEMFLEVLENFKAGIEGEESFYYGQVPVEETILFDVILDSNNQPHRIVRPSFLPYLKFLDLSGFNFRNVDVRGLDLSFVNIVGFKPAEVYMRSIDGTNLESVLLGFEEIKNVSARGANLSGTYAVIDGDSVVLDGAILDSTVTVYMNGRVLPKPQKVTSPEIRLHF